MALELLVRRSVKGWVPAAEAEQALFREAAKRVPKSRQIHNVLCMQLLAIADEMLEGEIAFRRGNIAEAETALRQAIDIEEKEAQFEHRQNTKSEQG